MKKVLNIVNTPYRATGEEQDDTVVWLSHAMRNAGSDLNLVLRHGATNYAIKGSFTKPLQFGSWKQAHPAQVDRDLEKLANTGCQVYLVSEDAAERGLEPHMLHEWAKIISIKELTHLFEDHDLVLNW